MKVNIGPYINRWTSQVHYDYMNKKYNYQWEKNTTKFETFLEKLEDALQWVYNHTVNLYLDNKKVKRKVKIHDYDTWSMDHTLSHIILPMLIQLKASKHGAPLVDLEDVPKEFHPTKEQIKEYAKDGTPDPMFFDRWEWIMDEMIYAFEQKCMDDWQEPYYGEWIEDESKPLGGYSKDTDYEGMRENQARISNGLRLFGKYYENLWD